MEASDADAPPSDGKPWAEVVADHAEALGMDATADAELLWIAERSLRAPLPDGWRDAWDATHRTPYYYSDDGDGPQWEHPRDAEFRALYEARGVSTVLVVGGSGDFFDACDCCVLMDECVREKKSETRARLRPLAF